MKIPKKLREGFSWDEALFLAKISKHVYEVFQHKSRVEQTELKELYQLLYPERDWTLVHGICNSETNIRGLIIKKNIAHQYAIVFRGSIVTDGGMLEITDLATDIQWELVKYSPIASQKSRVVRGFLAAYESVADQISFFFKTLVGTIEIEDIASLKQLTPERRLACLGAIADAGAVRLGADFARDIRNSIFQGLKREGMSVYNGHGTTTQLEQSLTSLAPVSDRLEIYIGGHSLGGCLANLCALNLREQFDRSRLALKIYTFGTPKIGNLFFSEYYEEKIEKGFSHRVENVLDPIPKIPLPLPFPLNLVTGSGVRVGEVYLGDYAGVGDPHTVIGLGSQNVSLNFGGALEFLGGIPFPHSFDAYFQLLEEQQKLWMEVLRPLKVVMMDTIGQFLQEQKYEIEEQSQQQIQILQRSLDELKNQIQVLQYPQDEVILETDCREELAVALPKLAPEQLAKIAPKIKQAIYEPGSIIVRQGAPSDKFYIIAWGEVEVFVEAPDGKTRVLRKMGQGEYFGEIGLLSQGVRTATVRALSGDRVKLLVFDRETFKMMLSESEAIATQLAYSFGSRIMAER